MIERWRYACPYCESVSLYVQMSGGYRCKQCAETFTKRYDKKHDRLV